MILRQHNRYQDLAELKRFVEFCQSLNVRRYLEIGSRFGDSFYAVMANLKPGAFGMAIDLPESADKQQRLRLTADELGTMGHATKVYFVSSRTETARLAAANAAPFDLVLIDADHTYDGVKADYDTYAPLANVVVLHDVAAPDDWMSDGKPNGVGRFWREISRVSNTQEWSTPNSKMGYGVVWRNRVPVEA